MKCLCQIRRKLFFLILVTISTQTFAQVITGLSITGSFHPSIIGELPVTEPETWFSYQFADDSGRFTWFVGPGTDGGIIFGKAQPIGSLSGEAYYINGVTYFFSKGSGISIDSANTIDMSNLWIIRDGAEDSLGGGINENSLVPQVNDITSLGFQENGWQIFPDGTYHLIYHTILYTHRLAIHLTGSVIGNPPNITGIWPANGDPGTIVFTFGEYFVEGQTIVAVNNVDAPIAQVLDDGLLVFMLPQGNTTGPVQVTTRYGVGTSNVNFGEVIVGTAITGHWPAESQPGGILFLFGNDLIGPFDIRVNGVSNPLVQQSDLSLLLMLIPINTIPPVCVEVFDSGLPVTPIYQTCTGIVF